MADPALLAGAVAAGASTALAVLGACRRAPRQTSARRRRRPALKPPLPAEAIAWLAAALDQAGASESPARVLAVLAGLTLSTGSAGAALGSLGDPTSALAFGGLGLLAGPAAGLLLLRGAISARRERFRSQLTPLLELLSLELSAGAAPGAAFEAVTARLSGELSLELRRLLAASRVGASPLDAALTAFAERNRLPALATLGGLVAAGREYGSSLSAGVRQLAAELRREERRSLIAASRRALNRILVPAALGVLAPFMGILLYPALTTLAGSFH